MQIYLVVIVIHVQLVTAANPYDASCNGGNYIDYLGAFISGSAGNYVANCVWATALHCTQPPVTAKFQCQGNNNDGEALPGSANTSCVNYNGCCTYDSTCSQSC